MDTTTDTVNKRQRPGDDSPPKQAQKKSKGKRKINNGEGTICAICENVIAVTSENNEGDVAKVIVRHGFIGNVLVLASNYLRFYVSLMILFYVHIAH